MSEWIWAPAVVVIAAGGLVALVGPSVAAYLLARHLRRRWLTGTVRAMLAAAAQPSAPPDSAKAPVR